MTTRHPAEEPDTRRSAGVVGLAVIASRLFGLIRDQVFAAMFGAGELLDAYIAAFRIPNMLRDLFAEGALSQAFTALFTRTYDREGQESAWALANLTVTAMIFLMGLLCIVAIILAPYLIHFTSPGFVTVPGKFALAVNLTRLLFPFILFVSLAAVVMGMLNARFVFGIPASASTVFNIVSIVTGVVAAFAFDPGAVASWPHPVFSVRALYGVSFGVLLGGVAQLAMQLPVLAGLGFKFHWRLALTDPRLRELWRLMWPSLIAGSTVQVNVLVNSIFASNINGAQGWLTFAFRLMQLPIGLFGVSIATATLPAVARRFARNDLPAFGATVRSSLRLVLFLCLPSALGLAVLARPIIALIYQHGHFSSFAAQQTAMALQAYAIGLTGYAAAKVLTPCFYALQQPKTPFRISLIGMALNFGLNFLNARFLNFGHVGLALTTSVVAILNCAQLSGALGRRIDLGAPLEWLSFLGRVGVATALSGWIAWWAEGVLQAHVTSGVWRAPGLLLAITSAALTYFLAARLLNVHEASEALSLVRRRLTRRSPAKAAQQA